MRDVPSWLDEAVAAAPEKPAVIERGACHTYRALDERAGAIAARLRKDGAAPGEPIGICIEKSFDAVAAIYGVLRAGACYVPLDAGAPAARTNYVLRDCGTRRVLVSAPARARLVEAVGRSPIEAICVDGIPTRTGGETFSEQGGVAERPAAILYTSGSTGAPKGAVISHGNLGVFLDWAVSAFALRSDDRLLSHAPLHFDLSFFDVFGAAACGGAVVLATATEAGSPLRLAGLVEDAGVTVWQSVPSALTLMVLAGEGGRGPLSRVRAVLFAGERMPRSTLLALPRLFPGARLYNIYGCTETNDTFMYAVPAQVAEAPDPLPIGQPLPYVHCRVVDSAGLDVLPGEEGQLLVATPTMMLGYVGRDTRDGVIVEATGDDGAARRYYCTKDVVRIGPDGDYLFVGRIDSIVKTNGYRVNLQEIEDLLRRSAKVEEAAVVAVPDDHIGNRIVAVVRPRANAALGSLEMKLHCSRVLPKYAIPRQFTFVDAPLPKSSTGKTDKRHLALALAEAREPAKMKERSDEP